MSIPTLKMNGTGERNRRVIMDIDLGMARLLCKRCSASQRPGKSRLHEKEG
jgi:hypothetical protein